MHGKPCFHGLAIEIAIETYGGRRIRKRGVVETDTQHGDLLYKKIDYNELEANDCRPLRRKDGYEEGDEARGRGGG
eukprot:7267716-Pyramimonas_sp.AAC.2